jgi:hypothetical protein
MFRIEEITMRAAVAITLIIVGGIILLAPVIAHAYTTNREKERIAEFYSRIGNAAVLPDAMQPSPYSGYDWGCFVAGAALAWTGIRKARSLN